MDETPLEVLKVNEQEVREEYRAEDRHRKKETEKTETQKKCWSFQTALKAAFCSLTDTPGMTLPLISGTKIILDINLPTQIVIFMQDDNLQMR